MSLQSLMKFVRLKGSKGTMLLLLLLPIGITISLQVFRIKPMIFGIMKVKFWLRNNGCKICCCHLEEEEQTCQFHWFNIKVEASSLVMLWHVLFNLSPNTPAYIRSIISVPSGAASIRLQIELTRALHGLLYWAALSYDSTK